MLAEIINPSDAYTIEGEWPVICTATLLLGEGHYPLQEVGGDREMPIFLFGGKEAADEWMQSEFGKTVAEMLDETKDRLPDALDSVLIGSASDRAIFNDAMSKIGDEAKRKEFADAWHDRKRTSMNDIGARAKSLAQRIRKSRDAKKSSS
jgi:hypothetical protein